MPETITAMVLEQFGQPVVRRELPVPRLQPGEVLLRLRASGVCGSDLDIVAGQDPRVTLPLVPGHEGIGEIAEVCGEKADVTGEALRAGDLVAFNRGLTCGKCAYCGVRGQPELCAKRETYGISMGGGVQAADVPSATPALQGCYAEYIVLREGTKTIRLPGEADPIALVPATCSGATAANAVELAEIQPGDTIVVIGPGPLGLYAAALALDQGAGQVVMIGRRRDRRLELAERIGCVAATPADGLPTAAGAAVVIDCAGTAETVSQALELVAPGGTIAIPGVATPLAACALDPYVLSRKQVRLQGVWTSNARHLQQALALAQSGRYPLGEMVTHVLPLEQANEGLRLLRDRQAVKVVLAG